MLFGPCSGVRIISGASNKLHNVIFELDFIQTPTIKRVLAVDLHFMMPCLNINWLRVYNLSHCVSFCVIYNKFVVTGFLTHVGDYLIRGAN